MTKPSRIRPHYAPDHWRAFVRLGLDLHNRALGEIADQHEKAIILLL